MGPRKGLGSAGRCWEVLGGAGERWGALGSAGERWDALRHAPPLLSDSPPPTSMLRSSEAHLLRIWRARAQLRRTSAMWGLSRQHLLDKSEVFVLL